MVEITLSRVWNLSSRTVARTRPFRSSVMVARMALIRVTYYIVALYRNTADSA